MRIAITGHTSGLGKALYDAWPGEVIGFSRSTGHDIDDYVCRQRIIQESANCEVFINCAHSGMSQVYLLYELCTSWQRTDRLIINISSNSGDGIKPFAHVYAVEKTALDKASEQLAMLPDSPRIVNLRPGYLDVDRLSHLRDTAKIPLGDLVGLVQRIIETPHGLNIHGLTILPRQPHDHWYYSNLSFPYFDEHRCGMIRNIAKRVLDERKHVGYEYSDFDHLRFYDVTKDMPELRELAEDCIVPARADIFFLPPHIEMPIHSDTMDYNSIRASTIAVSLLPDDDIPDTHWYWSKVSKPCATARWQRNDAKLLNIQSLHGGIKTDGRWRANLQLSISVGYNEVLTLIREGRLFRNHEVRLRDEH